MIPAGKYLASVVGGELTQTKKGQPQAAIQFEVAEGEHTGQRITAYKYFTDAALNYTVRDLVTCGHTGDDVSDLSMLHGLVRIVVVDDTYEGKTSQKVKSIYPLGSSKPMEGAKAWAEGLRSKVAAAKAQKPDGDPRPEPPPHTGIDDAPF